MSRNDDDVPRVRSGPTAPTVHDTPAMRAALRRQNDAETVQVVNPLSAAATAIMDPTELEGLAASLRTEKTTQRQRGREANAPLRSMSIGPVPIPAPELPRDARAVGPPPPAPLSAPPPAEAPPRKTARFADTREQQRLMGEYVLRRPRR